MELIRKVTDRLIDTPYNRLLLIALLRKQIFQLLPELESCLIQICQGRLDSICLLYTSPSPRDATLSRMPSSA